MRRLSGRRRGVHSSSSSSSNSAKATEVAVLHDVSDGAADEALFDLAAVEAEADKLLELANTTRRSVTAPAPAVPLPLPKPPPPPPVVTAPRLRRAAKASSPPKTPAAPRRRLQNPLLLRRPLPPPRRPSLRRR